MIKNIGKIGALIGLGLIITTISSLVSDKTQKIPLEVLFGDPIKTMYRFSPNGEYISYLALGQTPETKQILNVWVKSYDKNDDKQVTFDTLRPIRSYFWSYDNKTIFYLQDNKGDENWSLYSIDKDNPKNAQHLTPFDDTYVTIIEYDKSRPNEMLIGLNKDNPELHDAYLLNIVTKEIKLIKKNDGSVIDWFSNQNLEIIGYLGACDEGKQELVIKNDQNKWESHLSWNCTDIPCSIHRSSNGKFYFTDYDNSSTNKLVEYDPISRQKKVIAQDTDFDIEDILQDEKTGNILAVLFNRIYREWEVVDPTFESIYKKIRALDKGIIHIVSHDENSNKWIVAFELDSLPGKYYIYDAELDSSICLGTAYPELEKYKLNEVKPISYKSRDGLIIHGYLTQAQVKQPAPLILVVHGGPSDRDSWGYDAEAQWLASRGYNVLQINFRGSKGFGKEFEAAANKEWGRKMHHDLLDGIQWLTDKGMVDPKKVAIYGCSYGGYAALVGAAFTPDVFCCAIDLVGPSNLITLLKSMPPYWKAFTHKMTGALGDVEKDEEFLKERSPLFKAHQIKIPLLIAQGAHDPRVKQAESEQIVEALRQHNIPHTYKLYEDEGHGFVHAKNRFNFYSEMEAFLQEHIPAS